MSVTRLSVFGSCEPAATPGDVTQDEHGAEAADLVRYWGARRSRSRTDDVGERFRADDARLDAGIPIAAGADQAAERRGQIVAAGSGPARDDQRNVVFAEEPHQCGDLVVENAVRDCRGDRGVVRHRPRRARA